MSKVPNPILTNLVSQALEFLKKGNPEKPGPDNVLTPREASQEGYSIRDYVNYLESFNVKNILGVSTEDFFDSNRWNHQAKTLAHILHFGYISQKKAALVYDIWRLSAVVCGFNRGRTAPPYIVKIDYPSRSGGKYSVYYLSNTRPQSINE